MSKHISISPAEAADRLAIRELVEAYAHCADRRDAKGQMALFTADTHFVVYMNAKDPTPSQELHSREALAPVFADLNKYNLIRLLKGDVAILRFLYIAAVELIESDLWQQYAELGGVTEGTQNNYQLAFQFLDGDGSQYITSNSIDEISHATFLNGYLESRGADPVNFDEFRTLQGSTATGAQNIGRLTNLMQLSVDTSWYIRYRSSTNPDFGATFPQAIKIVNRPAIPRMDADFNDPNHIQAIANTEAFHFGCIEQGGSSLYPSLSQKVRDLEVLKITLGIGGDEIAHFLEWVDFAGNAVQGPPFSFDNSQTPVTGNGPTFPNFNVTPGGPLFQTNLIFPVPREFIQKDLPRCSVIRPLDDRFGGASCHSPEFHCGWDVHRAIEGVSA